MKRVLAQLNSTPGVVGSLMCDVEGHVLAQVFPSIFDTELLRDAAVALSDSTVGLEDITGTVDMLDFRFGEARLIAKPMMGAMLLVLCAKTINLQLLLISLSVAVKKLADLVPEEAVEAMAAHRSARREVEMSGTPAENVKQPSGFTWSQNLRALIASQISKAKKDGKGK